VGFSYPGDLWYNPVAVADLLQLWADAQGASGGGVRSGLNCELRKKYISRK